MRFHLVALNIHDASFTTALPHCGKIRKKEWRMSRNIHCTCCCCTHTKSTHLFSVILSVIAKLQNRFPQFGNTRAGNIVVLLLSISQLLKPKQHANYFFFALPSLFSLTLATAWHTFICSAKNGIFRLEFCKHTEMGAHTFFARTICLCVCVYTIKCVHVSAWINIFSKRHENNWNSRTKARMWALHEVE